jgi:hypothetical protein
MNAFWVLGLLALLLTVAYDKDGGAAGDATRRAEGSTPISVAIGDSDLVQPGLSDFLLLHRQEGFLLHAMTRARTCPE